MSTSLHPSCTSTSKLLDGIYLINAENRSNSKDIKEKCNDIVVKKKLRGNIVVKVIGMSFTEHFSPIKIRARQVYQQSDLQKQLQKGVDICTLFQQRVSIQHSRRQLKSYHLKPSNLYITFLTYLP